MGIVRAVSRGAMASVLGIVLAVALAFSWPQGLIPGHASTLAWLTVGSVVLAGLCWYALGRLAPLWRGVPLWSRAIWLAASILCGWLLTWMIPLDPAPGLEADVRVQSLATRSPASKGTEVWTRIVVDGKALSLGEVEAGPTWTEAHGYLISPIERPADWLRWRGQYTRNVYIEFYTHDWSGHALARWNDGQQTFDLYSPAGGDFRVLVAGQADDAQFLELPARTPIQYLVQTCQSVAIGLLLLGMVAVAARYPSPSRVTAARGKPISLLRESLLAALPLLIVGSILLLIFNPGILTTDSLMQWNQARNERYEDAHPVLFTFYLWLVQQILPSTALAVWLQMAAMALATGWLAAVVRRACNATVWTSLAGGVLMAVYPLTALFSITLWKDIPYATTVVALTALVIGNVFLDRPSLRQWYNALALVLLAAACIALRHNGPPVALTALLILIVRPGTRLRALACLVLAVGLAWAIKGPLADWVDTKRTSAAYMVYSHHLAAHLAQGHLPSSTEDRALLDAIDHGADDWRYNCAIINPTIFNDAYSIATAVEHQDRLLRIWLEMARKRPDIEFDHLLCASSMVWRFKHSDPMYLYVFGFHTGPEKTLQWVQPGLDGPAQASPVPETAWRIGRAVLKPEYAALWRPAPFLLGLCLLALIAWQRTGDPRMALIPALVLVHSGVLMAASIAQDARYQLPVYIVFLAAAPAMAFARRGTSRRPVSASCSAPE